MEYEKTISLLDNETTQRYKFWTKHWVEINDQLHGTYNTNSHIKLKTKMLKSV